MSHKMSNAANSFFYFIVSLLTILITQISENWKGDRTLLPQDATKQFLVTLGKG